MDLLLTHLTRMKNPYICAAGFQVSFPNKNDFVVGEHIRPVRGQLDKGLLQIFQLGAIVNLGPTTYIGHPPETEDYSFEPKSASITSRISEEKFWTILEFKTKHSLSAIFGSHLQQRGTTHGTGAVVNPGTGERSLGELQVKKKPNLYTNDLGQLRIQVEDPHLAKLDLSVTDVRFYENDQGAWRLKADLVESIGQHIKTSRSRDIVLAVGLTREFLGVHWLQANNIFFKENPLWAGSLSSLAE